MNAYQVAIKNGDLVVYAGYEEAKDANEAINQAAKFAQVPFNFGEAYDAHDIENDKPLFSKIIHPYYGQFRVVV